ncbi:MAG: response regulator, partial [Deltaproteobacteria bacterium]|nr:response regulator [Deltaproteobacteria bacterium]
RFREILHNVHLVAVGLDVNGKITFCNDFLLDLTGWNRDEIIGHDWFSIFVPEEHLEKQRARFAGLTAGNMAIHGKTAIVTRDGERRIISWNNTVLRDPLATITGLASIGEDITDKIRADALLLQTERIKAVGEMAGAVAHNFNNLLQIVMGSAQLALVHLETGNVAQIRPGLEQIIKSSRLGAQTVQRLQEFARVRHEETDFEGKVFDLSPVVKQAVEMSEPWWKTNPEREGIRISLRLDLVEGCFVRGKENELFEVAVNLIKNAVEALSRGGEIRIRTGTEDGQVVMTVEDNGLGIPESEVRKVFEPFWTTKGLQGTGLGLSSCYGIVRRHKGEISVDSALGNGTRFTVKLPHEPAKIRPTDASEQSPELHLKILLVDDMPDILHMLENGLAEFGQTVYVASSGQEAVSIFQETPIDMVICDLGMEGMNGWQVSEKIREICRKRSVPKTPFLLLTGWGGQLADKEQLAAAGIDKVVSKPVTITRLLEAARDIIVESNGPH